MHVLITGSSGQLGGATAALLAPDHQITGLDLLPGRWTTHTASVSDRELIFRLLRGVDVVIHIASLHAPNLATRSKQDFIDINVSGTLNLLEAAAEAGVRRFVYTSTTSVYGHSLEPQGTAVWVTEKLVPQPRDMYDITKLSAEQLCRHFAERENLPAICLRTARFFPEGAELEAVHRLYRGVDVRDVAAAHLLAATNSEIAFDIFNISARSPFQQHDLPLLLEHGDEVVRRYYPRIDEQFTKHGWTVPNSFDRVYVIEHAERRLGYRPEYNFNLLLESS